MPHNPALADLLVDIASLQEDPRNARRHDDRSIDSIVASLAEFGQQKPIVVLIDGTVIAGNGTLRAAQKLGWTQLAVVRFVDEKRARAYAIADNRTSEMSSWDGDVLIEALQAIRDEDGIDLESIGFSDLDLERMVGKPTDDPSAEWDGMPEFDQQDKTAVRQIVVNFKTEEDARKFAEVIGQSITDKTRSIWFPKAEIDRLMDKRYSSK